MIGLMEVSDFGMGVNVQKESITAPPIRSAVPNFHLADIYNNLELYKKSTAGTTLRSQLIITELMLLNCVVFKYRIGPSGHRANIFFVWSLCRGVCVGFFCSFKLFLFFDIKWNRNNRHFKSYIHILFV